MFLDFDTIKIHNFKCFKDVTLDLMQDEGLYFVRGRNELNERLQSNGAGKSSLWDALCWCLYGRTPSGLRNPDVSPWDGSGKTAVLVVLYVGDQIYDIQRTIGPNRLLINKDDVGQEQIDKLLGLPFEVFTHTVLLGQSQPLFFDLEPRHKMQLFGSILDLEKWDVRSDAAKERAQDIDRNIVQLEAEIEQLLAGRATAKNQLDKLQVEYDEWEQRHIQMREGMEKELERLGKELETLQEQHDVANLAYDSAMTELKGLRREHQQLTEYLEIETAELTKISLQRKAWENEYDRLKKLQDLNICPTCGQKLPPDHTARNDQMRDLKKKIAGAIAKGVKPSLRDDLLRQIEDGRKHIAQFNEKAETARHSLDYLNPQLAECKANLKMWKDRNREWEGTNNPYQVQITDLKRHRKACEVQMEEWTQKVKRQSRILSRTQSWVKGFKDVKLYVIEEILSELELITNAMLPDVGLSDWSVHYAIEKETKSGNVQRALNVIIQSPANKSAVRWESFSGGESQRLRIIGALALSEVLLNHAGVNPSLEILDEPTAHLSSAGRRDLIEFLAYRARILKKGIYYIDHHSMDSGQFSQVLTVIKTKSGSTLQIA